MTNTKPENPPAFPQPPVYSDQFGTSPRADGMTLRDYFAAAALQGILYMVAQARHDLPGNPPETAAKQAYEQADAMLKARAA